MVIDFERIQRDVADRTATPAILSLYESECRRRNIQPDIMAMLGARDARQYFGDILISQRVLRTYRASRLDPSKFQPKMHARLLDYLFAPEKKPRAFVSHIRNLQQATGYGGVNPEQVPRSTPTIKNLIDSSEATFGYITPRTYNSVQTHFCIYHTWNVTGRSGAYRAVVYIYYDPNPGFNSDAKIFTVDTSNDGQCEDAKRANARWEAIQWVQKRLLQQYFTSEAKDGQMLNRPSE